MHHSLLFASAATPSADGLASGPWLVPAWVVVTTTLFVLGVVVGLNRKRTRQTTKPQSSGTPNEGMER